MASVDVNKLISKVKSALGKPYLWGAEGPDSFDCSGLIYWAFNECGVKIPRTSQDQKAASQSVSLENLYPGDLLFNSGATHVYMYIGNNEVIHSPQSGESVKVVSLDSVKNRCTAGRLINTSGEYIGSSAGTSSTSDGSSGARTINTTKSFETNPVTDWLLDPTNDEKRYGINIYECEQPLIKFSTYKGISESGDCTEALKNYAEFLYYLLNSEMSTAQVTCIGMPWIRPGFNVWFDPIYSDTIYYCTDIQHYGDPIHGSTTSLTLILGRDRKTYSTSKDNFGSMKEQSDNVMINESIEGYKTKDFGSCYDSDESFENLKNAAINYYGTEAFETIDAKDSDFHKRIYEDGDDTSPSPKDIDGDKVFSKSYTKSEIQSQLDNLYSNSPDVIQKRISKLQNVMTKAQEYIDNYHILEKHTFE